VNKDSPPGVATKRRPAGGLAQMAFDQHNFRARCLMQTETSENGLFVETGNLSNVVLNWILEPIEGLQFYAKSYHSAARRLLEKSSQVELCDTGACPVVFLYRHSLELFLKEILIGGQGILRLEGKPFRTVEEILVRQHSLSDSWNDLKDFYMQIDMQWTEELGRTAGSSRSSFH